MKVRPDGTVKVLDFGLAKAFQPDPSDPNMSASPTISLSAAATQMGMVIGTAAYMSPEQAKGKVADKRADIWAFGVVLLEMLTEHPVFSGETVSETLAAVMGVTVETEPTFSVGIPEIRVDGDYVYAAGQGRNWDISPDGQRFLMLKLADQSGTEDTTPPQITVVLNWFEELTERVPVP